MTGPVGNASPPTGTPLRGIVTFFRGKGVRPLGCCRAADGPRCRSLHSRPMGPATFPEPDEERDSLGGNAVRGLRNGCEPRQEAPKSNVRHPPLYRLKRDWTRAWKVAQQVTPNSASQGYLDLHRVDANRVYAPPVQRKSVPSARLPRLATLRDRQPDPLVPGQIGAVAAPVRVGLAVPTGDRHGALSPHPSSVSS
jgi:hypothetical protein